MPKIKPFRGLFFSEEVEIKKVVTPPYDVITPRMKEEFLKRSPFNVVRLILPEAPEEAKKTLLAWLKKGILKREEEPSIYPYKQVFSYDGKTYTRWGFIALVELEDQALKEHENTMEEVVSERFALLKITGIQTGEIFSLYQDAKGEIEKTFEALEGEKPKFELTDDEGVKHQLWALKEPSLISFLQEKLQEQRLFIADGHHRLKAAKALRNYLGIKDEDSPFNYVSMYLTDLLSEGLLILPIHRIVYGVEEASIMKRLQEFFKVEETSFDLALEAHRKGEALVLFSKKGNPKLLFPLKDLPIPPHLEGVDSVLVDWLLLGETGGKISFTKDREEALRALCEGADMVFLLRGVKREVLERVVEKGEIMPKKSTYFYPKVLTGLVFYQLFEADCEVDA